MTTIVSSVDEKASAQGEAVGFWQRLDGLLMRIGDRLNPILVKETRQALKSRQFTITFVLVLTACWVWSIMGIAMIGPRIYYSAEGPDMFFGYYCILAFPLAVIIPFSAYRSLAAEREDNTYDLLSITNLSPRQIISGKLGSAVAQMLVYFSAVAPCLAFTYMLRGIDIVTVGLVLYYSFFGSLGLSVIGLFLATITRQRYGQVIISVILVLGLAYAFYGALELSWEILRANTGWFHDQEFWVANGAILTAYATYFAMIFLAASAQITFPTENRSTALRWVMLAQHTAIGGWMAYIWMLEAPAAGIVMAMMTLLGIHWAVMGMLMTGESGVLSPRARRGLPQSFAGRVFLTWLNPGPGTGYALAVMSLISGFALGSVFLALDSMQGFPRAWGPGPEVAIYFMALLVAYAMFFLGLGNLVLTGVRLFVPTFLLFAVLVHVLIVLTFTFVPLTVQLMSPQLRHEGYTLLQISNPFWSLAHIADGNSLPVDAHVLIVVVPLLAVLVFLANLPSIVGDLRHVRMARPARVVEEDAAQEVARHPPARTSPWD